MHLDLDLENIFYSCCCACCLLSDVMPQIPWIQILDMLDCRILGLSIEQEALNKSKGTTVDNA